MDRSPDPAALDWRIALTVMSGDQKQQPVAASDRLFEAAVDCPPRGVESHAMKVEHAIGLDRSAAKPVVPSGIECAGAKQILPDTGRGTKTRSGLVEGARPSAASTVGPLHRLLRSRFPSPFRGGSHLTRQRPNSRRNPGPELGLLRVERAHGPRPLWEEGSAPVPRLTFPRRSPSRRGRRPKRCRTGWLP